MFLGAPLIWRSRVQRHIANSSAEAEYIAMAELACELQYFRQLMESIRLTRLPTIPVMCDNKAAIALSTQEKRNHNRTKHMLRRYNFVREQHQNSFLFFKFVPSGEELADILTKPVRRSTLRELLSKIRISKTKTELDIYRSLNQREQYMPNKKGQQGEEA